MKNQPTGVSTFASHTSPSTDQSLQKSFHLSHLKRISKYFSKASKKIKVAYVIVVVTNDRQKNQSITVASIHHYVF